VTTLARRIGLRRQHVPLVLAVAFLVLFLISFLAGYVTTG
jgi:hypothetical protein